jgi:hypothetical protein
MDPVASIGPLDKDRIPAASLLVAISLVHFHARPEQVQANPFAQHDQHQRYPEQSRF